MLLSKGCPLVEDTGAPLPKSAAELTEFSFDQLMEEACSNPRKEGECKWVVHGYDVPVSAVEEMVPEGDVYQMPTTTGWARWEFGMGRSLVWVETCALLCWQ